MSKRKKRTKRNYFTSYHEDAILEYCSEEDSAKRNQIYSEIIEPCFKELINKVTVTYKFHTLPDIDELKNDCLVHLVTILDKYNPYKYPGVRKKAFSYFTVVTINWFRKEKRKNIKKLSLEVGYEEYLKIVGDMSEWDPNNLNDNLIYYDDHLEVKEHREKMSIILEFIDEWIYESESEIEVKALKAIKIVLNTAQDLPVIHKKAVYHYLREIGGLEPKQLTFVIRGIREKYREDFLKYWLAGDI